jgi:hypothetical protein
MKTSFNLSKFLKTANYEDGKGLIMKQTRCYSNCQKAKLESGMGAQEAWNSCLEEFQKSSGSEWALKYSAPTTK